MENINFTPDKDIESARSYAIEFVRNFRVDNSKYKKDLTEILNSNKELKRGFQKYDGTSDKESFTELAIRPWGNGNGETRLVESIESLTNGNKEKYPKTEVLEEIKEEWIKRTNEIKEELKSFQGNENDAFDLIQKIHKEKVLKPLNEDSNPLMVSI